MTTNRAAVLISAALAASLPPSHAFASHHRLPSSLALSRPPLPSRPRSHAIHATDAPSPPSPPSFLDRLDSLYRFSRPHTIRGTLLACFTGVGRALIENPISLSAVPPLLPRALLGVLALLLGNLFIVGINQIYDVEIDTVNKPFLPIAAGSLSPTRAWVIITAAAVGGLAIVKSCFNPFVFWTYLFGCSVGGLYSVPPFHFKRSPLAAGLVIALCRGFLLNSVIYYATRDALGLVWKWSAPVTFLARFMTVYAASIAVTKDLPDVQGDRKGGIETFASRFGWVEFQPRNVAFGASGVLLLNYVGAIATALLSAPGVFRRGVMIGGHAAAAVWLIVSTLKLKAEEVSSIKEYYKQIWNLFYFEYLLYFCI
ncbi:MAG: hypothetical protein SGPRY_004935 [Prymnesium sp.]